MLQKTKLFSLPKREMGRVVDEDITYSLWREEMNHQGGRRKRQLEHIHGWTAEEGSARTVLYKRNPTLETRNRGPSTADPSALDAS